MRVLSCYTGDRGMRSQQLVHFLDGCEGEKNLHVWARKQRLSFGVMVDAFPKYLVSKFPQTEEVGAGTATLTAIRPVKPCTMAARLRAYMT